MHRPERYVDDTSVDEGTSEDGEIEQHVKKVR
jgi:hypothetical protein